METPDHKTIYITGACGFVGGFLTDVLEKIPDYKLILNCRNHHNRPTPKTNFVFTEADLTDTLSLDKILTKYQPEIIIHLGGITRVKDGEQNPNEAFQVNYEGTISLIDLAEKHKVKKFIFVSTDMVRNYQSVIGITKFLSEAKIQQSTYADMQVITLRLPNISWTPGSVHTIFEKQIKNKLPITITHPDMSRRFIAGKETAEYILQVIKTGKHKDLFVINKPPTKITELAREMIRESGAEIDINFIGARPGEKLAEDSYDTDEVEHTSFGDLSLLKRKTFGRAETNNAIRMLKQKPGFTLTIKEID